MANSKNKQSNSFVPNVFGVAKKFSRTGLDLFDYVAPNSVTKLKNTEHNREAVEGQVGAIDPFQHKKYSHPQDMLREHLPQVSRQIFGRHFNTVNNVAHFVSPQLTEKFSDYVFEQINDFTNQISSVDAILDEVGAAELEELTQDIDRSCRISTALAEQNKWLATVQGALSGATGVVGQAVDIPASLVIALRTIYQVGRSYGFELEKSKDQDVVQYIFQQADLGLIAEKQAVLLAVKTLANTLKNHDLSQLQSLVGSGGDYDAVKQWLVDEQGQFKWQWLNQLPKVTIFDHVARLSPLIGAGVGAVYSWRLVEDVAQKAQHVFSTARHYLLSHQETQMSLMVAYEKALQVLSEATPKLLQQPADINFSDEKLVLDQAIDIKDHPNMSQVKVIAKTPAQIEAQRPQVVVVPNQIPEIITEENDERDLATEVLKVDVVPEIQKGIEALAEELVSPVVDINTNSQQKNESIENDTESKTLTEKAVLSNTADIELKPRVKKTTKKTVKPQDDNEA
jgi:hypothetical protein